MKDFFFTPRLYIYTGVVAATFCLSFFMSPVFVLAQVLLLLLLALTIADGILICRQKDLLSCERSLGKVFSLGDENKVTITIRSKFSLLLHLEIIDEVPYQFQMRNFKIHYPLKQGEEKTFFYMLVPKSRGLYHFLNTNVLLSSPLRIVQRRIVFRNAESIPVYPSLVQMKKYELQVTSSIKQYEGLKKIHRIGHSYEFDHIKNYVIGEDPRSINWKASSRRNELMINHFEDEKSQQVYCILNKSRLMNMPSDGLSLLDYSINTSLTILNIAQRKADKIGLLSFSDKIGTTITARRSPTQLRKIMNALYNESENNLDPNYELLYSSVRYLIPVRSLIFLFTNFETMDSLQRNLQVLRRLNRFHLLVPVIFENAELEEFVNEADVKTDMDIHHKVIARKMQIEKDLICSEMKNHGIQYIKTKPQDLSINTINKYLELKARGLI